MSETDSVLYTDDEVDEFAQGVAQYEPDAWEGNSDDSEDAERDLAQIPLATLAKAKKSMKTVSTYDSGESSTPTPKPAKHVDRRESKNAPTAMSSKKQVSRLRQVVDMPKVDRRDPRFSGVSAGNVDMELHEKGYSFLPEMLKEEYHSLRKELSAATKAERTCARRDKEAWGVEKERLERLVAQTRTRLERTERESRERHVLSLAKKEERDKRASGKGAWYMKKGAQRDLLLKSKFEALEERGGKMAVKRAMDKKRKKIAGKEKKSRPM